LAYRLIGPGPWLPMLLPDNGKEHHHE